MRALLLLAVGLILTACSDRAAVAVPTEGKFTESQVTTLIERFFAAISDYDESEVEAMVSPGSFPSLRSLMVLMEQNDAKAHLSQCGLGRAGCADGA